MWANNEGRIFNSKADAFDWMNNTDVGIDSLKLYCDTHLQLEKNMFGIFDCDFQVYLTQPLPVEIY